MQGTPRTWEESLHLAVGKTDTATLRSLLERADIRGRLQRQRTWREWRPLHRAAHLCDLDKMRLLLAAGARPASVNDLDAGLLHTAAMTVKDGVGEMIELLLSVGVDPGRKGGPLNQTPMEVAAERENQKAIAALEGMLNKNQ